MQTEKKFQKKFVEDVPSFSIGSLGRGTLRGNDEKVGYFLLGFPNVRLAKYRIVLRNEKWKFFLLEVEGFKNFRIKEIDLKGIPVTFGSRPAFVCPGCGSLRYKLHLSERGHVACRICFDLVHQSTRDSHGAPIFRLFRRFIKLREKDADVHRVEHNGRYTRKAKSVMNMAQKWLPG